VPIEAGSGLVMLVRVVEGKLERFRKLGDDCPIDAGGRTIHWLDGVTPAESLRYLDTLTRLDGPSWMTLDARRTLARDALAAIALHRDAGADAILDRVATSTTDDTSMRTQAASLLGRYRGAHGFATLQQLVKAAMSVESRRALVSAIGQSREAGAVEALRALARDPDEKVRAEAAYRFAVRGGPAVATEVLAIVDGDAAEAVRHRAVSGIAQWPNAGGVPQLITLARSSRHPGVRKQAVSSLSSSRDPRAIAYLESLLK
jgi:HEAT repeat protein